ncbi:MAG: tRNA (adenosine(37)-N6)-threonylcarbamoyltransferase complex transferase subunit TsaD [Candidatus Staskawiczbacteria bacterium]|nr:tRNA (adenosine(37)-N6)-threonylcarbamoyltransferase complex transferase subunit TsaD [Candidatus Staskawiczbacteria bacterium]
MKILSIETSCDDTGIAILEAENGSFKVLSNIVASQIEIHKKYGGVYPAMAKREHQRNLLPTLIEALRESELLIPNSKFQIPNFKTLNSILEREPELLEKIIPFLQKYEKPKIDLISVTNGPGLEPCLWVGVNFAKALSCAWDIPIVPVNHIESHILINLLNQHPTKKHRAHKLRDSVDCKPSETLFPAVCLVVSGGHTQIILMKKIGKYKILGETRDDAAGECFDKCAKILGLAYPGGPEIAKLASRAVIPSLTGNPELTAKNLDSRFRGNDISLPRPMFNSKDYDFSFSGLKTAVLYKWQKLQNSKFFGSSRKTYQTEMATEIQQAIVDVLLKKTIKAAKDYKAKTIILGGGVSANSELRKQLLQKSGICKIIFPEPKLSTDNGLMTAITGFYHKNKTVNWKNISANGNLRIN